MLVPPNEWGYRFQEAHQSLANYFGVEDEEQLLLTPGCTSSLSVAIHDAWIERGQRVLTSQWEHHALHRPILKLASAGVRVEYIPTRLRDSSHASPIDLEWLDNACRQGDVGLVAITAACNVTGELLTYESVVEIAHQHGAMVLIDAAQIVGWKSLNFPRIGADLIAFGGHKGLQAPWGIGGLYLSPRAKMECTSAQCDLPTPDREGEIKSPRPGYCDVGSVDQFALAGLNAAIGWLQARDHQADLAKGREQIGKLRRGLEVFERVQLLGSDAESSMPTLAFAMKEGENSAMVSRCREQGLILGSGLQCAPLAHTSLGTETTGALRFSVGIGQSDDDVDAAIELIQSLLA